MLSKSINFYERPYKSAVIMKHLVSALTPGQHCKRCSTGGIAVARFFNLGQKSTKFTDECIQFSIPVENEHDEN